MQSGMMFNLSSARCGLLTIHSECCSILSWLWSVAGKAEVGAHLHIVVGRLLTSLGRVYKVNSVEIP